MRDGRLKVEARGGLKSGYVAAEWIMWDLRMHMEGCKNLLSVFLFLCISPLPLILSDNFDWAQVQDTACQELA